MRTYPTTPQHTLRLRAGVLLSIGVAIALALGCGGGKAEVPLLPVSGIVRLGGGPMPMGTVEFHPDTGKGNAYKGKAVGTIKSDGRYTLHTEGREGAPAGWYKVTVTGKGMPDPSQMTDPGKMPKPPAVNPRYTKADTTNLSIEVKEGAAATAYDLSLIK